MLGIVEDVPAAPGPEGSIVSKTVVSGAWAILFVVAGAGLGWGARELLAGTDLPSDRQTVLVLVVVVAWVAVGLAGGLLLWASRTDHDLHRANRSSLQDLRSRVGDLRSGQAQQAERARVARERMGSDLEDLRTGLRADLDGLRDQVDAGLATARERMDASDEEARTDRHRRDVAIEQWARDVAVGLDRLDARLDDLGTRVRSLESRRAATSRADQSAT